MKKSVVFLLLAFLSTTTNAQQTVAERNAKEAFSSQFAAPRESLFLHLNKSVYIKGEDIWFKGYVYNRQEGLPFKETSNLYVGLYDSIGKQISKKLYRVSESFANGNISLDSSMTAGVYYIKASTNWMRNFNDKAPYVQQIKVYDHNTVQKTSSDFENKTYDVQFLPEGGTFISGLQNTIGVKCIGENGLGVAMTYGKIVNEKGEEVASFDSSHRGMASFVLKPLLGETYRAILTFLDGKKGTYLLPKPKREGFNISLIDENINRLLLVFGREKGSDKKYKNQELVLWLSKDGLAKRLNVDFVKEEKYASLVIDKTQIYAGMNTFTLLDEAGRPIIERLYYNHRTALNTLDFNVSGRVLDKDSVLISIASKDRVKKTNGKLLNLSISVLPKTTEAYKHKNTILSTFLLKPYVRGYIEDPSYYFKEMTRKKQKELNLLLLTQGWSSYDWDAMYSEPTATNFKFEQGIELFGRVQSKIKDGDKLLVHPFSGFEGTMVALKPENPVFKITNVFPKKGQEIKFSVINDYGNIVKPKMFVSTKDNMFVDRITNAEQDVRDARTFYQGSIASPSQFILPKNAIALNEVTVTEEVRKKKFATPLISKKRLTKMTKKLANSFPNMLEIIRSSGYYVYISYEPRDKKVFISSRRPISSNAVANGVVTEPPLIYIDDIRLVDFDKLLYDYSLSQIDSYFIDKSGYGEGGGGSGVIRIYTKDFSELAEGGISRTGDKKIFKYNSKKGFEPTKRFYNPEYFAYDDAFLSYGTVHWEPEVLLSKEATHSFKVFNTNTEEVNLYIEGMGKNGKLVSIIKSLKISGTKL